jgi:hypothetical protein
MIGFIPDSMITEAVGEARRPRRTHSPNTGTSTAMKVRGVREL